MAGVWGAGVLRKGVLIAAFHTSTSCSGCFMPAQVELASAHVILLVMVAGWPGPPASLESWGGEEGRKKMVRMRLLLTWVAVGGR